MTLEGTELVSGLGVQHTYIHTIRARQSLSDWDMIGRKRCNQHRLGRIRSRTRPQEVIPEEGNRQ